jgi:hypothetical protein
MMRHHLQWGAAAARPTGNRSLFPFPERPSGGNLSLWGMDIPWVHQKDKRPHERPVGPIIRKVIPSWAWGGTFSEAD